jgi:hypothetical protein
MGAQGERLVVKHLTQLSQGYTNINDVKILDLGGNIDRSNRAHP